jgi:hypothetical protein
VKKQLLAGGEDEVLPAVHAFEYFVLEFHDPVAYRRLPRPAAPALLENRTENYLGPATEAAYSNCVNLGGGEVREGDGWCKLCKTSRRHRGPAIVYTNLRARGIVYSFA